LQEYLRQQRQDQFVDTLCRKLLSYALSRSLILSDDPLLEMNFIKGLYNEAAVGVGIHPGQTGNLLSGARLQKGAELRGGISMDQVLANRIGRDTLQSSLVLGCEQPTTGYHETNFSMAYSSHISWQAATSPVPMETYPALAFDTLFENRGAMRNRSVLDRVGEHARSLKRQASGSDRAKLDEYLKIVQYYCGQVAYLAERLEAMPEGDSNVLENSLLMFMSNMWSGSQHDSTKVPLIQIGGLGGTVQTGRVLDYSQDSDDDRRLCSLYLSLMDRMGVKLDRFGDSKTRLAGF
jgi:hypothetical protein